MCVCLCVRVRINVANRVGAGTWLPKMTDRGKQRRTNPSLKRAERAAREVLQVGGKKRKEVVDNSGVTASRESQNAT